MYLETTIKVLLLVQEKKKRRQDRFGRKYWKKGKKGAGNSEGDDVYETEITLEELMDYIVEDLELPNLDRKKYSQILSESASRKEDMQDMVLIQDLLKEDCYS